MRIVRVSETLSGHPMVEIDIEPVDDTGTLHVSEELANILKPYLIERDNIALRFIGKGLPTTAIAVVSEMYVKIDGPIELLRWYAIRAMIFGTPTGKTGVNVHFQPVRIEFLRQPVGQAIPNGPIYNFKEVYNDLEESSNDMERLLKLADAHFSKSHDGETKVDVKVDKAETPWWRKLF